MEDAKQGKPGEPLDADDVAKVAAAEKAAGVVDQQSAVAAATVDEDQLRKPSRPIAGT